MNPLAWGPISRWWRGCVGGIFVCRAFYCLSDVALLSNRAKTLGLACPIESVAVSEVAACFDRALPVVPLEATVTARAGKPDPANAPAVIEAIATGGRRRARRGCRRHRHQPDQQEDALRRRLSPSRAYGVPRNALGSVDRNGRPSGDDAGGARTENGACHNPHAAQGCAGAFAEPDRRYRQDGRDAIFNAVSRSASAARRHRVSTRTLAKAAHSATKRNGSSARRSRHSTAKVSTTTGPLAADAMFHPAARAATTRRCACTTTRR